MGTKGKLILTNFIWRFMERVGAQSVSLIVFIILARILSPTDYGTVALINVFINVLSVLIDSGFGNALIQKKDSDDVDFSSVFYVQLFLCAVVYLLLFVSAPFISEFYGDSDMTLMIRVLGLTIIIAGVKNIQVAYVSKKMIFKKFFFATIGGTIGAASLGIILAYLGFGAWALIVQSLFNNFMDTVILWITVKWRPKKKFSFDRIKGLLSFSWKLLVSAILDTGYNNLRSLIIGKVYTSDDLAYYEQGNKWPYAIITNIDSSIGSVLFPALSSEQDDKDRVRDMMRRTMKTSTYIIAPMMVGLAVCSKSLVHLLLTDKWMPMIPFLVVFCVSYIFYPLNTANLSAINALGRSDTFLKLEVIKKIIGLVLIIIAVRISVMAVCFSIFVCSIIGLIINAWPNRKYLGYGIIDQIKDVVPSIFLALIMGCIVYAIGMIPLSAIFILPIQVFVGIAIYYFGSKLLKLDSLTYIISIVSTSLKARD